MHDYLSDPWAIIFLVSALIVIFLTIIQIVYSLLAYYSPHNQFESYYDQYISWFSIQGNLVSIYMLKTAWILFHMPRILLSKQNKMWKVHSVYDSIITKRDIQWQSGRPRW